MINSLISQKDRIPTRQFGLDLMRACSILMVFLSHSIELNPLKNQIPYFSWLGFGVEAFFVLSGFLIGRIILKTLFHPQLSWSSIRFFWINRWLRTLPAYFVILAIYFLLSPQFGLKTIVYIFFCQNIITPTPYLFPHSWSLAVEEWFYFIFPIFLLIFSFLMKKRVSKYRIFLSVTLLFIFFGFISKTFLFFSINKSNLLAVSLENDLIFPSWKVFLTPYWDTMRKMVPFRIDAISYGCLIALLLDKYRNISNNQCLYLLWGGVGCLILSYFLFIDMVIYGKSNIITDVFVLPLFSISFALMIPSAVLLKTPNNKLITKVVTNLSIISYSFYLSHLLIIELIIKQFKTSFQHNFWLQVGIFIICYCSIHSISYLMYKQIEMPFLNYRDKLRLKYLQNTKR